MRIILPFAFLLFCALTVVAQSSVNIQITHLLNEEKYEQNLESSNDLENDFKLERLEYYLSKFEITHDGGQKTEIEDLYVLVTLIDKTAPTKIELGQMNIENIEAISFYLGIDEETNHADPSLWPVEHPLAPKFPSMHWGWAAGYRFIALEGLSGPDLDQELQFHCIGDEFYKKIEFPVTMTGSNEYMIEINAEYTGLLKGIDISAGLIIHGNLGAIKTLATNIQEHVFSISTSTAVEDHYAIKEFNLYPNPSMTGLINFSINTKTEDIELEIIDMMGKVISKRSADQFKSVQIDNPGFYIASLRSNDGQILATRKLIVE